MKKTRFALLSLALLGLFGCTRNGDSSLPSSFAPSTSSDMSQSSKAEEASSSLSSSKEEHLSSSKGEHLSSSKETSSSSESDVSSSSEPIKDAETLWGSKNASFIKKYLNDTIIPYFDMKKNLDISYKISNDDYGILTIIGEAMWVDGITISTYRDSINATPGWSVKEERGNYILAENAASKVQVKLFKDEGGYVTLDGTYDEVYDKTSVTDWDEDTLELMKQDFKQSVPFVYLGTKYPQASYNDEAKTMTIIGKKFNESFLSDGKEALIKAGYTITNETTDSVTMSGLAQDAKSYFSITLGKYGTSLAEKNCMKVTYDPEITTQWSDDVKNAILDHLDGHELPFLYLGKSNPSAVWETYQGCMLTLTGGDWKDDILDRAKASYSQDKGWTSSVSGTTFTSSIKEDDGCQLSVTLSKTYAGLTELKVEYTPGYKVPTGEAAKWKSDMLTEFSADFGADHVNDIPYVYLNSDKDTFVFDKKSKTLTLTGGIFAPDMLDVVKQDYDAIKDKDGNNVWTTKKTLGYGYYSYDTLTMNATMSDGCNFAITLTTNSVRDTIMKIQFEHFYDPKGTSWDEETASMMKLHLVGNTIPYLYMNIDKPSVVWSETSQQLTLTGGTYQAAMMKEAEKNFKDAGYAVELSERYGNPYLSAEKQLDGCYVSVEFSTDSYKGTTLAITVEEDYDESKASSWNESTKKLIEANFSADDVPYVYLGTANETASYLAASKRLSIYGNCFNSMILTKAKKAFQDAGYTCEINGNVLAGYKKRADGKYLLLDLEKQDLKGFSGLFITLEDPSNVKQGSYSDDVKEYLTVTKNHEIPYIYMGEGTQKFSKASSYSPSKISGKTWDTSLAINAHDVLVNDGYEVHYSIAQYKLSLSAKKTFEDGTTLSLEIAYSYSGVDMSIYTKEAYVVPSDMTSWSEKTLRRMKKCIDNNTIPFFYIGTDSPKISERDSGFDLTGTIFDEQVFAEAKKAFEKEGGWEFFYDYGFVSSQETKKLNCSKKLDSNQILTVVIYGNVNNNTIVSCYLNNL